MEDVDERWPEFASETRNLQLALSSDGFNPFQGPGTDHSCWLVLLSIYNLPPWLCMKRKYIMLSLLISGPNQPRNDIDVFLQPYIEDLQKLWHGKQVYDSYKKESFILRGILLWTVSDYPALGNLSGNIVKGYNACVVCVDQTKATMLSNYKKMVVMRHRRWLPRDHPYRRQKSAFYNTVEKLPAPIPLTGEEVFERLQPLRDHVYGKTQNQPRWKKGEPRPISKKLSIFFQLEYWKFLPVRHFLDVMHIEKNICEALTGTLLNILGKTKDREYVRLDMADMGIKMELRPKTPRKKEKLPMASWNLLHKEKKIVCSFLLGMKLPDGFCSNIKGIVSMESLRLVKMKSHDCHTMLHHLLPITIRARPEGCIVEAYVAEEAVECLVNFKEATVGLPGRDKNNEKFRPLSGATMITLSIKDLHQAHLCVLQNSNELSPYFNEHMAFLMTRYPRNENDEEWLKNLQNETFPKCFKDKISSKLFDVTNTLTKKIIWLAEGPNKDVPTFSGYKINGITYNTKDRDDTRQVQCSGVCVDADTMLMQGKDKNIEHISHTFYGVISSIWELDYNHFRVPIFRCNWVDMNKGVKVDDLGYTVVNLHRLGFMNDPFVLGKHVKQVCYIDDPLEKLWSVLLKLPDKYYDQNDDEYEGSVEIDLENELDDTMFPTVDLEEENSSYMREEKEMIQLP